MITPVRFSPARRLDAVGLNPQPLPPKYRQQGTLTPRMWSLFDKVALNPQPLPPRDNSRYQKVALNPQPLPPKVYAEVNMSPALPQRDVSLLSARLLSVIR